MKKNRSAVTVAIDGRRLNAGLCQVQLERPQLFCSCSVPGSIQEGGKPLDGTDVLALRIGWNRRTLISSSMRWRSGLMGFSLIGGSCLEVGVLEPLNPQDGAPARHLRSFK